MNRPSLLFAQVREDAELEIGLLEKMDGQSLRMICVASGGCLLLNILAACPQELSVDVVDLNSLQIQLAQKKLEVISQHSSVNARHLLASLNQSGAFERLFASRTPENHQELFSCTNLTAIFGPKATQSGLNYADHFDKVYQKAQANSNQFHEQLLYGEYRYHYPRYLNLEIPLNSLAEIKWHQSDLLSFLKQSPSTSFDLLHLSNIFDWEAPEVWPEIVGEIARLLKPEGRATIRSLGSEIARFWQTVCRPPLSLTRPRLGYQEADEASGFYQTVLIVFLID